MGAYVPTAGTRKHGRTTVVTDGVSLCSRIAVYPTTRCVLRALDVAISYSDHTCSSVAKTSQPQHHLCS